LQNPEELICREKIENEQLDDTLEEIELPEQVN